MSLAKAEERIGLFPYDPSLAVKTAWDIGVDDYTAIWFFQENGHEVRAIDYYETSGEGAEAIIRAALPELLRDEAERAHQLQQLGRRAYAYSAHYLPHDVKVREWGAGAKTRFETLMSLGMKNIHVGVPMDPADRINAARRLLPIVSFDAKRCVTGIDRLRNYRKRWNSSLSVYTGPLHDENSHGSDAFGEFAVNCAVKPKASALQPSPNPRDLWSRPTHDEKDWMSA